MDSPITIVLVDDSAERRANLRHLLHQNAQPLYTILETNSGKAALDLYQQSIPAVILADDGLPDLPGLEFLQQLKQQTFSQQVPLIILTEQGDETIAVQVIKQGAQDYRVKSKLTPEILQRAVQEVMAWSRSQSRSLPPKKLVTLHSSFSEQQTFNRFRQELEATVEQRTAALRASEERFRHLVETSSDWIWEVNEYAVYTYASSKVFNILGYQPVDIIGKTPFDLMPAEAAQCSAAVFESILATRQPIKCLEHINLHRDGHLVVLETSGIPIFDQQGQFRGYRGVARDITIRKRAEEELQQTRNFLQTIIDNLPVAVFVKDGKEDQFGTFKLWNKTSERLFGLTAAQTIGKTDYELFPLEQAEAFYQTDRQTFTAGHTEDISEECIDSYSLDQRILHTVKVPIYNEKDEPDYLLGVSEDITERKLAERELARVRDLRDAIFNELSDALFLVDSKTLLTLDCNQRAVELFDAADKTELIGIEGHTLQRYPFSPDELAAISAELQLRGLWSWEIEYVTCKGNLFWGNIAAKPITVAGRTLNLVRVTDVSDRKRAEEALQESQAMLQLVLDTIPQRVFWKDRHLRFLGCNSAFARDSGLTPAALIGKTDFELPWAKCASFYRTDDTTVITTRTPKLGYEEPMESLDGEQRWLRTNKVPLTNSTGEVIGILGSYEDITDHKRAEEQLLQTNHQLIQANVELARATRLKDEFLANMSHELRTPLNAVLGMSEALLEEICGSLNERQRKAIKTIEKSGHHLLELINDVLDLAKIEAGKLELQIASVSVNVLCNAILTLVKPIAEKKNIRLTANVFSDLGYIQADERLLQQVLINLLSNAIKFTPNGGSVTLEVRPESQNGQPGASAMYPPSSSAASITALVGSYLCFSVIDTGIGIPQEKLDKIFQPFVQVDSALNRQYPGTGLGLALAQRIVNRHQGTIAVASKVGQGSRFTVQLPQYQD